MVKKKREKRVVGWKENAALPDPPTDQKVMLRACPWRRPLVSMAAADAETAYSAVEAETASLLVFVAK